MIVMYCDYNTLHADLQGAAYIFKIFRFISKWNAISMFFFKCYLSYFNFISRCSLLTTNLIFICDVVFECLNKLNYHGLVVCLNVLEIPSTHKHTHTSIQWKHSLLQGRWWNLILPETASGLHCEWNSIVLRLSLIHI